MNGAFALVSFAIAMSALGCGQSVAGRVCDSSTPCPAGFACVTAHDGSHRCMADCSLTETVCRDGTACLPLASGSGGACYLGGNVPIGSACTSDLDCTRTGICIHGSTQAKCLIGCNLDGTHACGGGQPCLPTTGSAGYCGGA